MMTKLIISPTPEDETEGVEIGGLIYLETVKREEEDSGCIPAALTGYVCPGLFTDPAAEGWMHFGGGPKKGAACFVIPAKKYKAWSAFLPKSVVSRDTEEGTYYVWFLMDRHPEGCSARNDEVMLFWDGFTLLVPTRVHKWLPNPPETLATLTCAEAFRILGIPEPVAIPPAFGPYAVCDEDDHGIRLNPGNPCLLCIIVKAERYAAAQPYLSAIAPEAPVFIRSGPDGGIGSYTTWMMCKNIPPESSVGKDGFDTSHRDTEGVMIIAGGMDGPIAMGTWITEPPSDPEAIPVVDYADAIAPILANPAQLFAVVPETVRPAEETAKEASTQAPACSIRELWPKPDNWPELHFDDDVIPWELKKLPQWLNWHPELRDGKITKIPTTPVAGNYTRTDATRASWDYDECRKAMAAGYRGYVGIGLSLRGGLFGIDLDHVIDPITRQLKTEYAHLQTLIDKVATYTEISPSGTGLHIYGKCENIPEECRTGTKRKENIEMYCSGRFLTISSMVYAYPQVLRNLTGEEYFEIYSELFGVTEKKQQLKPETKCKEKDDSAIITLLKTKDRKGKYIALWNGSSEGYDSPSEADFALGSQLLKLTGMNKEQAIRLFQKSERAKRDKLVNRPELIDLCIENALKRLEDEGYEASATTVRLASLFSGNNWQTEAAHLTCLESAGRLKDIRDAGNGNYAVIDPGEDCVKLCATGREPAFRRWCNAQFPEFGYDPKFAEEMFREISELYTANPIPEIDITRPITAIRCLDGYISLKDGKRCDRPAEMEYCPFTLHLTAEEAELKPDYQPTGRVLSDLLTYVGESTTEYLLSVTAASIPRIPANRRVVMFTGPSRSFKTTYGMLLSELGLAPPRNVDFSSEVNGRSGQFRPELANNISQYPMLFVNDPHEPDGTTIKKLCDETQQYESKYVNKRTVYQRATCVFTVNDSMKFRTSAMDAKSFFVHSYQSYLGAEIPLCDYLDEIHSDGSLVDLWQSIQKTGLAQRWRIVIPQECEDHNKRMQIGSSPLQKWLSGCRPALEKTAKYFVTTAEAYEDYMVFVNPFTDEYTVKEKLQTKAKAATWKPDPRRDGLEGTSKSDLIKQLQTMGYVPTRLGWNRGFYMRLPEHLDFFTAGGAQHGGENDEVKVIGATTAWGKLFGGDRQVVL